MLSSQRLNQAAIQAKLDFCITCRSVRMLAKPRPNNTEEQEQLMTRLRRERKY